MFFCWVHAGHSFRDGLPIRLAVSLSWVHRAARGTPCPTRSSTSIRKLAQQLEVARNTVVLAYQQLIAEGYLVSRERSGIYVNEKMLESRVGYGGSDTPTGAAESAAWTRRTRRDEAASPYRARDLPNWNRYPYPFIDGKFDPSLFPLAEWREACRLALGVADAPFIRRARALRRTLMTHPPLNNQRAAAYFLSLGHYDALMMRLGRTLHEHRMALRDALNWMRGVPMEISTEVGGTTYWVRTPDEFDVDAFVIPYLLGLCAEFDTSGQMAALGGFASKMGLASGPMVAGILLGEDNYSLLINAGAIAVSLAACTMPVLLKDK